MWNWFKRDDDDNKEERLFRERVQEKLSYIVGKAAEAAASLKEIRGIIVAQGDDILAIANKVASDLAVVKPAVANIATDVTNIQADVVRAVAILQTISNNPQVAQALTILQGADTDLGTVATSAGAADTALQQAHTDLSNAAPPPPGP